MTSDLDAQPLTSCETAPGAQAPSHGWRMADRLYAWRDRLFTDARFIRRAERFILTRPLARREARAVFDICSGFVYAQTLFACVRLGVFDALARAPQTGAELAARIGLDDAATHRLLVAAAALRLVEKRGRGRWGLGRLGAAVLASPGLAAMVEHHDLFYRDLADPIALLKGEAQTRLAGYWPYADDATKSDVSSTQAAPYSNLMAATQPALAQEILDAVSLKRFANLMDVGGGDGAFLAAAAKRWPHLGLVLYDLPAVASVAERRFADANLLQRASVVSGDFSCDALPKGVDVVSLIRVVLDHDDARALTILRAVRAALPQDGTLILAEPMAETKGAETLGAYFNFYLLAMGRGRPRTKPELASLLRQAGFSRVEEVGTCQPLLVRILLARP